MVQKTQEFCTMTQGAMRVEEYERHFMKMMRYAPEDTNLEQKKQFWFLRGLHHGLRQGLKASEHNSLRHLMNYAIALEEDRRGHEDRMQNKKRMGDRGHFDRSSQRLRDGPTNMMRGNLRSGINQHRSNFGGGISHHPGGGSFNYRQQNGGYNRPWPSTLRPSPREFTPTCFACGKLGQVLPVP
jgi:hypothetical protein